MNNKLRILFLEDLSSEVELAKIEFNKVIKSLTVKIVDNEKDYISAIKTFQPDLIVSKYMLPSFDSLSALKIKQDIAPFIPFILLTGSKNEKTAVEIMKAGADDYIIKEHIDRLGHAILSALEKKKSEKEKKQADIEIKQQHEFLNKLIDTIPNPIYYKDIGGKYLGVNSAFENLIGLKRKDIVGKSVIEFSPKNISQKYIEKDNELIHNPGKQHYERKVINKDGNTNDVIFDTATFTNQAGEVDGLIGIITDITELKKAVEELSQSELKLKKALNEITDLKNRLLIENTILRKSNNTNILDKDIIGKSKQIKEIVTKSFLIAPLDTTVLILGETGTGKELIARGIHNASPRRGNPLVVVNCASIPDQLFENELFGHMKGAYTDASVDKVGLFEIADNSTIFLDEIGELPLQIQSKLLRTIENKTMNRIGSNKTIKVNVRIISATNHDLAKMVHEKRFREDLYYRLNVYSIELPPLRNRKGDIQLLIEKFISDFNHQMGKNISDISKKDLAILENFDWPGNVRELKNIIERSMIKSQGRILKIDWPFETNHFRQNLYRLSDVEKNHIIETLLKTNWKIGGKDGAAELLGLNSSTLKSKIKKLGIKRPTIPNP